MTISQESHEGDDPLKLWATVSWFFSVPPVLPPQKASSSGRNLLDVRWDAIGVRSRAFPYVDDLFELV